MRALLCTKSFFFTHTDVPLCLSATETLYICLFSLWHSNWSHTPNPHTARVGSWACDKVFVLSLYRYKRKIQPPISGAWNLPAVAGQSGRPLHTMAVSLLIMERARTRIMARARCLFDASHNPPIFFFDSTPQAYSGFTHASSRDIIHIHIHIHTQELQHVNKREKTASPILGDVLPKTRLLRSLTPLKE